MQMQVRSFRPCSETLVLLLLLRVIGLGLGESGLVLPVPLQSGERWRMADVVESGRRRRRRREIDLLTTVATVQSFRVLRVVS
jgi:hypothetical protein